MNSRLCFANVLLRRLCLTMLCSPTLLHRLRATALWAARDTSEKRQREEHEWAA